MRCSSSPITDRRHARRLATRETILRATEELVLANGFASLKTRELVKQSGVSERTIFNHFDSLEDIVMARINEYLGPLFSEPKFPAGLSLSEIPAEVQNRLIENLELPEGAERLQGFLRLAQALSAVAGEFLAREVALTLAHVAEDMVNDIAGNYPNMTGDQKISLRLYATNLAFSMAFGIARAVGITDSIGYNAPESSVKEPVPSTEDLLPHIRWAFDQVSLGRPVF